MPPIRRQNQDALAFFGELILPFSDRFEMQLAARTEDYGGNIGSTFDPKVSAKFDVNDNIALRSSWGTSFLAPTIQQRFGAVGGAGITDPNRVGDGTFNVDVIVAGSDDLKPQEASNFNIGAILKTDNGIDVSIDYFDYAFSDVIGIAGGDPQSLVNSIFAANGNVATIDAENVNSALPGLSYTLDGDQLDSVNSFFSNLGGFDTSGIDINARWRFGAGSFGDVTLDGNTTIITSYKSDTFAGLDGNGDLKGSRNFNNALGSTPDFKFNVGATLNKDIHTANITVRHIASYTDDQESAPIKAQTTVDGRYTIDLSDLISIGKSTQLNVGVVNAFDQSPPRIANRPLFDTEVHDPRGRQIYVGFKQGF